MNNLKQLSLGLLMYAGDNKETYPAANDWCDALVKYVQVEQVFKCNAGDPAQRSHYALNARLAGIETSKVKEPARTVMVFEIQGGWNVSGGPELLLKKGRHAGAVAIAFADGHVEVLRKDRLNSLRWEP